MFEEYGNIMEGVVGIFIIIFAVIIGSIMIGNLKTAVDGHDFATAEASAVVDKFDSDYYKYWDYTILFIAVILMIGSAILAYNTPSEPIYLVVAFVLIIGITIGTAIIGNVYDGIVSGSASFAAVDAKMTYSSFLMDYIVIYSIIYFVIVSFALFSKTGGGGSSQ